MIGDIRKTLHTRPVRILLWLLVISFFLGIIPMIYQGGKNRGESLGTVNGEDIGILEFKRKFADIQNMIRDIRQAYGAQADIVLKMWGFDKRPDELVLDGLINEKVIKSVTSRLGAQVSNEYVQAKLRDPYFVRQYLSGIIPAQALHGGTLDTAALEYSLERQGISHEEFDEKLGDTLLQFFLFKLIEGGSYVPQGALEDAYRAQYLKKKYAYLTLPRSRYSAKAKEQKITDSEVKTYYAKSENQASYRVPEKRSAKVWSFSPESFGVAVTDKDLETAYQRTRRSYIKNPASVQVQHILFPFTQANKVEKRAQAQTIYNELTKNPETFTDVAVKYSQSKDKGTTITLKRTDKNQDFTKAAFALQKGSISPVIETPEGYEIIKLLERKEPEFKSLEEVKPELMKKQKEEKFAQVFDSNAQRVISQSREEPTLLTSFIERHKGQESTRTDETRTEKPLSARLFGLRKVGDRAFFEEAGKGYIVELTSLSPSVIPPLESVKNTILEKLYAERALALLKKDLNQGLADLRDKQMTLDQVAQVLDGKVETTEWVSLMDQESMKKLQGLGLKPADLVGQTNKGAVRSVVTNKDGYIVQVKDIEPVKEDEFKAKKEQIRFQLGRQDSQGISSGFVEALKDKAQISLNTDLLRVARA
jgi:parvulin-like peptidyl-prolyl isomerase